MPATLRRASLLPVLVALTIAAPTLVPVTPAISAAQPRPSAPAKKKAFSLQLVGTFSNPVYITSDPSDPDRLFVVERAGVIRLIAPGGTSTYLDLTSVVQAGGERGLLSVAFPPDHASTGLLYVFYTAGSGALTVAELHASGDVADPSSRRTVLSVPHPNSNHNGGQLQFGPDGYLYVSTGDGGGAGDPNGNGQNLTTLLGTILRIDPRASGSAAYTVPPGNPYAGTAHDPVSGARDEIWSWGLRNPWRFSFDRMTGALAIGDVGQGQREEVDVCPRDGDGCSQDCLSQGVAGCEAGAGYGVNFGWNCREGLIAFGDPSSRCASTGPYTDPVFNYPHSGGACSITGGYVVRDASLGDLTGRYVYADYCVGQIRSIVPSFPVASGDRSEGLSVSGLSSFGQDACGRIYVASLNGPVYRFAGGDPLDCDTQQRVVFANTTPPSVRYGQAPIALTATATSGLPVVTTAGPAEVCQIGPPGLAFSGPGICTVTATQGGNEDWNPAPPVLREVRVLEALVKVTSTPRKKSVASGEGFTLTVKARKQNPAAAHPLDGQVQIVRVKDGVALATAPIAGTGRQAKVQVPLTVTGSPRTVVKVRAVYTGDGFFQWAQAKPTKVRIKQP